MGIQETRIGKTGHRKARRAAWKKAVPESQRLDALLDAAAAEFNARGIAGARLAGIARSVGIGRAALYYYVDTREDLAYRCYLRACTLTAADLAAAAGQGSGLLRVEAYLRRALAAERAPAVVLSEIAYLGGARREAIEAAHAANIAALRGFIEQGIRDGSVRACDAEITAQAIFGMVSWVPLTEEYVEGAGASVRAHAAEALWGLVGEGLASDPSLRLECPLNFSDFLPQPGNLFDRRDAAAHKVELLLQTASHLFNRRGIDGTSLDDITAALGATKGAFYHHLPEKKTLVLRCAQRAFDLYERFAEASANQGRNGLERGLTGLHLNVQAQASAQAPLSPLTGLEALPPRALRALRERAKSLERRFERFSREGIRDGSYRPFDVRTLSAAGAGAFGWIPKWRGEDGPPPRLIADEMVALFAHGIRRKT